MDVAATFSGCGWCMGMFWVAIVICVLALNACQLSHACLACACRFILWHILEGDEQLTCLQVLHGVPAAHRLWQAARAAVDTAFPHATVTPHMFVTGNCSKLRAPYKEPGLLIDSNGHVVGCHFDDSGLVCFMLAGEKTFWSAPPLELGLNMPSGQGGANFGTSQAHANERHDVHPQTNLRVQQWFVAHLKAGDFFFLPAWWWHEVRTGPTRSWSVNMWMHEPLLPCPQRAHTDAIVDLEPDPVLVSGVTGKYSEALNGEYECHGTLHNDRPLFQKVNGSIFLRFDKHTLWAFCTKHTMHTSHASLAVGVTKNLPHPHQEVMWRTFVDKDTWGPCPTMSCTSFTPAAIDDATAPVDIAPAGILTPGPSAAGHSDGGGAVLADLMSMYASRSPSPSSSPTHSALVLEDSDTLLHATTSPSHAADALDMSQVFNESDASMPRPMHADFDLLRKLPFSACNLKNRRAQTFLAATATEGVSASHIGQYVVALNDWQPALSQVWVSLATYVFLGVPAELPCLGAGCSLKQLWVCDVAMYDVGCHWTTGKFGCPMLFGCHVSRCGCVLLTNSASVCATTESGCGVGVMSSGCVRVTGRESDCGCPVLLR